MPKLPVVLGRVVIAALRRAGFEVDRQEGSHVVMVHEDSGRIAVVPMHGGRDLPAGTVRKILRQASLTVEEFVQLLR